MEKISVLLDKTKETVKNDGVGVFAKKTTGYIVRHIKRENYSNELPEKTFMDVLFINGCFLPHPSRYRVSHQMEQLLAANMTSNEVFYENISLDLIKNYRVFIFFRCPYTEIIGEFIAQAKEMNKVVLFDVDDLVIDTKYTNQIKYLETMTPEEKAGYDDGVNRMKKTLSLCDGAITTTERLASELKNYVPEVYINRNTASNQMLHLSEAAVYERDILPYLDPEKLKNGKERRRQKAALHNRMGKEQGIKLGYFSGSITHNDDFKMILPVIEKLMEEYKALELHIVGELDIPVSLKPYSNRIIATPFVDWKKLPQLVASVDINLVPIEEGIFNEAKSENKWVEASLVKVVTVASSVGAFDKMIENNKTGMLCKNNEEWYETLKLLINDKNKRISIAENAHEYAVKNCTTIYNSYPLYKYIRNKMTPNIAFVLPSIQTSGGVLVVLAHCVILRKAGYDVVIINEGIEHRTIIKDGVVIPAISRIGSHIHVSFDKVVATLWSTLGFLASYANIKERYYFVQNFETDFYEAGQFMRISANQTYNASFPVKYITISTWCKDWLLDKYEKSAKYAPNGIDSMKFYPKKRDFNGKIRILVEGNSDDYYKNVDESFRIVDELDKNKFEIWFMSYQGKPKPSYYVDNFLHRVPYEKVPEVYHNCHILIKSSILESFSYPPLEMMATGGYSVVAPNDGNVEYLRDGENCLFYEQGNIESAVAAIERICSDSELRDKLYNGGINTADSRKWGNLERDVLALYDVDQEESHDI